MLEQTNFFVKNFSQNNHISLHIWKILLIHLLFASKKF